PPIRGLSGQWVRFVVGGMVRTHFSAFLTRHSGFRWLRLGLFSSVSIGRVIETIRQNWTFQDISGHYSDPPLSGGLCASRKWRGLPACKPCIPRVPAPSGNQRGIIPNLYRTIQAQTLRL